MKQTSLPEYTEVNQTLNKTDFKLHPSQAHGLICGLLCGTEVDTNSWDKLIFGEKKPPKKTHEVFQSLYDVSDKQLKEFLFELELLLPADSDPLPERAEALTLWSQGFLTGLKLAQVPITDRKPGEMTEAINDIIEIAKMNYESVVASEEDEAAYYELVEFVRMAVILIYQDLRDSKQPMKATGFNHLH